MDLSQDMRRNSFSSQNNIANDIIADIYVAADVSDEFASFNTDMSLAKGMAGGVGGVHDTLTPSPAALVKLSKRGRQASDKRSYSVDAIKFQYPQQQPQMSVHQKPQSLIKDKSPPQASTSVSASASTIFALPSTPRQRSQSAQYYPGSLHAIDKSSMEQIPGEQQKQHEEDVIREDLEDTTVIDSMIAEYNFPMEDFNNNDDMTSHHFTEDDTNDDGDEEDTNYHDLLEDDQEYNATDIDDDYDDIEEDHENILINDSRQNVGDADDTTDDITQASSFDDDCYVFDNAHSVRNE